MGTTHGGVTQVGIVHPGQMGITVAAALVVGGARVRWAGHGRSAATRARAAGLEDTGTLDALAAGADVLVSVCPPHAALDVAEAVGRTGFDGLYVDANAVSPATARTIGQRVEGAGATFIDGAIIGPPAHQAGTTRLYVVGEAATAIARLFAGSALEARVMSGEAGAASALKVCFASWTKGSTALLLALRGLARAEGVEDTLLEEWALSWPDLAARSERSGAAAAGKAWRWVEELREIGRAMAARGLPGGFGEASAEIYDRLAPLKDRESTLDDALGLLGADRPE
jgi:3-hydroxyisobutyrate dehydrogenase-like beta-hydroxyacid dehydrogenase